MKFRPIKILTSKNGIKRACGFVARNFSDFHAPWLAITRPSLRKTSTRTYGYLARNFSDFHAPWLTTRPSLPKTWTSLTKMWPSLSSRWCYHPLQPELWRTQSMASFSVPTEAFLINLRYSFVRDDATIPCNLRYGRLEKFLNTNDTTLRIKDSKLCSVPEDGGIDSALTHLFISPEIKNFNPIDNAHQTISSTVSNGDIDNRPRRFHSHPVQSPVCWYRK